MIAVSRRYVAQLDQPGGPAEVRGPCLIRLGKITLSTSVYAYCISRVGGQSNGRLPVVSLRYTHCGMIRTNRFSPTHGTRMHNPPHPGEVLRDGVFTDTGISVTDFAQRLGVTRVALSRVLNGKAAISAEMAVRLAAALGGSATTWLHLQANHDIWRAERRLKREIAKIQRLEAVSASRLREKSK
jgi:antitoxin HigA-1